MLTLGERMGKLSGCTLDKTGRKAPLMQGAPKFGLAKGQSMVEYAMVVALFFLVIFAVMDYGWLMFAKLNVQQAVDDGGRYASTGQETGSGNRIASIIQQIQNEIAIPGVNASNVSICSTPPASITASCYNPANPSGTIGAAGGPGYTVTISLTSSLPLMTPGLSKLFTGGVFTFTSSTTFVNEPFNPDQTD
jgi:Flp pilus assembly protein TadG